MRHYIHPELIDGRHRIEVTLIGAGGTGSHVLSNLGTLHASLQAFQHPGLHVTVYDDDYVSSANLGRQAFAHGDLGQNKAAVSVSRMNAYFKTDWEALPFRFPYENRKPSDLNHLVISCVDTAKARREIAAYFQSGNNTAPLYWLDFGNSKTSGQVILGTPNPIPQPQSEFETVEYLPSVLDLFPNLNDEDDNSPSCSTYEALLKQGPFTNRMVCNLGCELLWQFITNAYLERHGSFFDVAQSRTNPLSINRRVWESFGYSPEEETDEV